MDEPAADELDEVDDALESDIEDTDDTIEELLNAILDSSSETIRTAIRYSGDDYEVLYVRDDVAAQFSGAELEERIETLILKGLGDPAEEGALFDFGKLDATVRWYDAVVVAHFPVREWSGLVFTFDRVTDSLLALAEEHFLG